VSGVEIEVKSNPLSAEKDLSKKHLETENLSLKLDLDGLEKIDISKEIG